MDGVTSEENSFDGWLYGYVVDGWLYGYVVDGWLYATCVFLVEIGFTFK